MCRAAAARFADDTQKGPARAAAERRYAEAMQALGEEKEVRGRGSWGQVVASVCRIAVFAVVWW